MTVIAVAGGTGGVGRAIVDALNGTGKFEVVILSRKACSVALGPWILTSIKDTNF
jgi:uncharacterized protein YbjT (DUF2867 family)